MPLVQPFRALRPAPGRAAEVLAPPYDVLSSAEARVRAAGRPWSFLHVSKPEIDLAADVDPYSPAVYAKASENLARMVDAGVLVRDPNALYYVYRLTWQGHVQTGLCCAASVDAYRSGRIRRHELTTPVKEDDRVRQIEAVNAGTGPVMMAYPDAPALDALLAAATAGPPDFDVVADDGVRHALWPVADDAAIAAISAAVDALPALYIADGHHRSAAAARIAEARGAADGPHRFFLSVLFPGHEMTILAYNRLIADLNGRTPEALLAALGTDFAVVPSDAPVEPTAPAEFGMFLAGRWYRLVLPPDRVPDGDPIGRLPITLLSRHAIAPLFGITDQRKDKRIDFVGGGRGLGELERRVASGGMAVAFSLHATRMA
ncbi:MAG TPA: DUF1015 domain-containing protein, partial [Bauldia sp.]|nr:DUF1015 domain-containing protein [Bauldia sp.]